MIKRVRFQKCINFLTYINKKFRHHISYFMFLHIHVFLNETHSKRQIVFCAWVCINVKYVCHTHRTKSRYSTIKTFVVGVASYLSILGARKCNCTVSLTTVSSTFSHVFMLLQTVHILHYCNNHVSQFCRCVSVYAECG